MLANARDVWRQDSPEALSSGRVQFQPTDFFEENPVRGAEVYWYRMILHDWPDHQCLRILSAVRAAMGPRSRILLGSV